MDDKLTQGSRPLVASNRGNTKLYFASDLKKTCKLQYSILVDSMDYIEFSLTSTSYSVRTFMIVCVEKTAMKIHVGLLPSSIRKSLK